jgi:hypothetical protein
MRSIYLKTNESLILHLTGTEKSASPSLSLHTLSNIDSRRFFCLRAAMASDAEENNASATVRIAIEVLSHATDEVAEEFSSSSPDNRRSKKHATLLDSFNNLHAAMAIAFHHVRWVSDSELHKRVHPLLARASFDLNCRTHSISSE